MDSGRDSSCPYQPRAAMVTCVKHTQGQASQHSSMDATPTFGGGAKGSCCLIKERDSLPFEDVAAGKLPMPQWMAP